MLLYIIFTAVLGAIIFVLRIFKKKSDIIEKITLLLPGCDDKTRSVVILLPGVLEWHMYLAVMTS